MIMGQRNAHLYSEHNRMNKFEAHAYSAYGFTATIQSTQHLLGFNGEHAQTLTSLYILGSGYRAYDTNLMRFISPDSLSPFGDGEINAYAYCSGDPVNRIDPTGHSFLYPVNKPLKLHIPKRGLDLTLPAKPPRLAAQHFTESDLKAISYSENQYKLRLSKAELNESRRAILNSPNGATPEATKRFISLENRHHALAEGLNTKITNRYAHVVQQMTEQGLYRPEVKVMINSELLSLIRAGMAVKIPSAFAIRTVRPPY